MIVHVFRLNGLIYLVNSQDIDIFQIENPESEDIGIVPYWSTDVKDYVRVH